MQPNARRTSPQRMTRTTLRSAATAAVALVLALLTLQSGLASGLPALEARQEALARAAASTASPASAAADAATQAAFEAPPSLAADLSASAQRLRFENPTRGLSESTRTRSRSLLSAAAPPDGARRANLRTPSNPVEGRRERSSSLRLLLQTAQLTAG